MMDDNYRESIARMQSQRTIDAARFFYVNRDLFTNAGDFVSATHLETGLFSKLRLSLERYWGFVFERQGLAYRLVDITLKKNKKDEVRLKQHNVNRRLARANRNKVKEIPYKPSETQKILNSIFR